MILCKGKFMATTLICKWNYCKNKNQWTYVYEISTDDKTYLTFDEYLINEKKDDYLGWGIVSLSATIGLISIIYSLFIKRGIKEKLSKEYISVYY